MGLIKRLSDNLWSLVSPTKVDTLGETTALQAVPRGRPRGRPRKVQVGGAMRRNKSVTPRKRVDSWRAQSESEQNRKRKRAQPPMPSTGPGRRSKKFKREVSDEVEVVVDEGYEEGEEDVENKMQVDEADDYEDNIYVKRELSEDRETDDIDGEVNYGGNRASLSPVSIASHSSLYSEPEGNTSILVQQDYESPWRKKMVVISPSKEHFHRGTTSDALRAQGWDDLHIVLMQKIAMRGQEPLFANFSRMTWPWLPNTFFADTNNPEDVFIGSVRSQRKDLVRAERAWQQLIQLGGHVRDCAARQGPNRVTPDKKVQRLVEQYMKWCEKDSGLDPRTSIPLLVIETRGKNVSSLELRERAHQKLEKLAQRWREALRVKPSIEDRRSSRTEPELLHPMPTLYAILAAATHIGFVGYRPDDEDPVPHQFLWMDIRNRPEDVYNALSLAILVCHLRNVQVAIAEETGIGLKVGSDDEDTDDPDA